MRKSIIVSLVAVIFVFAVSGSALASPKWSYYGNTLQPYQQGIFNAGPYGSTQGQTVTVSQQNFFDLPQSHWAYNMIEKMKKIGVINGDSNGYFHPDNQVTRAEFATMLVRVLHLPTNQATAQTFVDVPANFWGFRYIEAARYYLTGYQNFRGQLYFWPQIPAVREDIIVALVRAEGLGYEQPDFSVLAHFVDAGKISSNLRGYIAIAVEHGLVMGSIDSMGRDHLYPQNKLTRAEATAFLYRIMQGNTYEQRSGYQSTTQKVIVGQQPGTPPYTQQAPQLIAAALDGTTLTLNYNENLDPSSIPYSSDFTVTINGYVQAPPTGVTVSGSNVSLGLYHAAPPGSTVTISYTPGAYPLRNLAGYCTPSLVGYPVNNLNTDMISPVWPQGYTLSVYNLSETWLTLTWRQATDNIGVTAYRIYEDGRLLTTVTGSARSYNITGLLPDTTYTFRIDAGDAAGNWTTGRSINITTISE